MIGRTRVPVVIAAIGLVGALAATLFLSRTAAESIDRVLEQRLTGAGESAAALLGDSDPRPERLQAVMRANGLDDVYLVGPDFRLMADASNPGRTRPDLLRIDIDRVRRALAGTASIAPGYTMGSLTVMTGYFSVRRADNTVAGVLVLEAGQTFVAARGGIARARIVGVSLSILSALGLAIVAARWTRAERRHEEATARAARGETLSRVAAMAAHEIRNPLGVIRGTIDLMRERSAAVLGERDRIALDDIVTEVERLRRLTQDLLDLAADRPLAVAPTALADLLGDGARATEAAFPGITVRREIPSLPMIETDAKRLRQVFSNLLVNAAEAQHEGQILLSAKIDRDRIRITVADQGPGISREAAGRLFDLYFTTKSGGTGLGLAVARGIVEQLGGTLQHLSDLGPGATFEVTLPLRARPAAVSRVG